MTRPVLIITDLDRTLIFTPRATAQLGGALPADPVETSRTRDAAAELSHAARDALAALPGHVRICVATTRSVARLARLRLPFAARYSIAANGGVVLDGGVPDAGWAARTAQLLARSAPAADLRTTLARCARAVGRAGTSWLERFGDNDDMCCEAIVRPELLGTERFASLAGRCAELGWQASLTGRKLYAFPTGFGKEHAAAFVAGKVARDAGTEPLRLAAGDAEHDRYMLAGADLAWVPAGSELARAWPEADHGGDVAVTCRPGHAAAAQIAGEWLEICQGGRRAR